MNNLIKKINIISFSALLLFHFCFFHKHIQMVSFGAEPVLNLLNNDSEYELILKIQSGCEKTAKISLPVHTFFAYDKNVRTLPEELILTRYKNYNNLSFNIPVPAYKLPVSEKTGDG